MGVGCTYTWGSGRNNTSPHFPPIRPYLLSPVVGWSRIKNTSRAPANAVGSTDCLVLGEKPARVIPWLKSRLVKGVTAAVIGALTFHLSHRWLIPIVMAWFIGGGSHVSSPLIRSRGGRGRRCKRKKRSFPDRNSAGTNH